MEHYILPEYNLTGKQNDYLKDVKKYFFEQIVVSFKV